MRKYIFVLAAITMALTSCDDWLNVSPKSTQSPDTFFTNESELQAFSNGFYMDFPASSLFNEQVDTYTTNNLSAEMQGNRTIPASRGGWTWTALRDYNTLIQYSTNCKDVKVREKYVALARFFRAYFYLSKVQNFGDVPWYDTPLGSADPALYKPRDSREYVMGKIIEDIDYAIAHLPSTRDVYKVTKWTALALKSRICLFEGTFRKYHSLDYPEHSWKWYLQQCEATSKEFIETSGYGIHSADGPDNSYVNLFASDDAISTEIILARDYSSTYGVRHNAAFYTMNEMPGMTKKMVDSYLMKDGSRFTDKAGWETMTFADEVKNRDPRLAQSIRTPGYHRIGSSTQEAPNLGVSATGYQIIKYVQAAGKSVDAYGMSYNDLPLFRSAEVYLNYAEAKAELGTLTQGDIDISIKRLRDRVGMPNLNMEAANANPDPYLMSKVTGYPHVDGNNKGVILEIRRERTIELAQEGFRYNDIMRWKEGKIFENKLLGMYFPGLGEYDLDGNGSIDVCLWKGTKPSTKAPVIIEVGKDKLLTEGDHGYITPHRDIEQVWNEDKDYYYPIPTDDRSLSKGNLTQNPGWNDGLDL